MTTECTRMTTSAAALAFFTVITCVVACKPDGPAKPLMDGRFQTQFEAAVGGPCVWLRPFRCSGPYGDVFVTGEEFIESLHVSIASDERDGGRVRLELALKGLVPERAMAGIRRRFGLDTEGRSNPREGFDVDGIRIEMSGGRFPKTGATSTSVVIYWNLHVM